MFPVIGTLYQLFYFHFSVDLLTSTFGLGILLGVGTTPLLTSQLVLNDIKC